MLHLLGGTVCAHHKFSGIYSVHCWDQNNGQQHSAAAGIAAAAAAAAATVAAVDASERRT